MEVEENSLAPLFKVRLFNQTDASPDALSTSNSASNCDLTIFVSQGQTLRKLLPIQIKLVYNSVLFRDSRMAIMLDQLSQLIESAATDILQAVGKISIATPSTSLILPDPTKGLEWDAYEGSITDIFATRAMEHPNRRCIVESTGETLAREFSYIQMHHASNVLANYFVSQGNCREDVIVLYSFRGVELVVAILAVLKAGCTFSVIDPAYPPERQIVYLSVARPRTIVVLEKAGLLDPLVEDYIHQNLKLLSQVVSLSMNDAGALSACDSNSTNDIFGESGFTNKSNTGIVIGPDSIGTLSFTSGSTGIPKGVRGRHFSLTHFYPWMKEQFKLGESDRFTMLSGIAHDPIQRDIFTPVFLGAELHIPTAEVIGIPGKLAEWMADHAITVTHLTPAMGQLLSANAVALIPTLRHAFFVGDVLTKRDVLRLQHLAPNTHVINMYGTTETQRAVSYLDIPAIETHPSYLSRQKDIMPAGKGMKNVQLLVINKCGVLASIGEVGEIHVRSGGLAEGYLNLPEISAEKFVSNPFQPEGKTIDAKNLPYFTGARDRMYRTGDLGRYQPDGSVECTGRADDQVKIRGFRIELGEIDMHLSQNPHIRENVTLVRRDKNEEMTIVTYFVPIAALIDDYGSLLSEVRNFLKKKLPSYAIPTVFVPLSRMPLTPNGKVDKLSLPFPDTALAYSNHSPQSNDTLSSLELTIQDIWAKLLGIDKKAIGLSSDFFDLGGHSITATRLVFEIRKAFAVDAPLGIVYRAPTLKKMSTEVRYILGDDLSISGARVVGSNDDISTIRHNAQQSSESLAPAIEEIVDYAADLALVDDTLIAVNGMPIISTSSIIKRATCPRFFLTGVTGFLGAFILEALFKTHPSAEVWCLVRANGSEAAHSRIIDNCKRHLINTDTWAQQVHGLAGDLASVNFGLSTDIWSKICEVIDIIIHNGALVHWVYPYDKLRGPNVIGTKTALSLATTHHIKPLHFVSSTSVLDTDHYARKAGLGESVMESDNLSGSRLGLRSGYGQTKWVAEQLLMAAKSRGLPITIIRPGYIVGHSKTGVTNTDDFIWRLVKGCIQLGKVPRISNIVNLCSVDYVANCVVQVASQDESISLGVFHTYNSFE